jgi:hypothetical protein
MKQQVIGMCLNHGCPLKMHNNTALAEVNLTKRPKRQRQLLVQCLLQ